MKKTSHLLVLFALAISISSCSDSICEQEVTYTKAEAIYANLDDFRISSINESPRLLSAANKIFISKDLLIISEKMKGIHIYDNTNPESPTPINFLNIPGNNEMYIDGQIMYADSYYDMVKIDISNPLQANIVERIEEAIPANIEGPNGTKLIGFDESRVTESLPCYSYIEPNDYLYFDYLNNDISQSAIPSAFVSNGNGNIGTANRIAKTEDYILLMDRNGVHTFQDEASFNKVQEEQFIGEGLETIFPQGDLLYIGSNTSMQIFRIDDNATLEFASHFAHATACDPVLPTNEEIAYVTLRNGDECPGDVNSLSVLDVSNLNQVFSIQEIEMQSPYGMTIHNNVLYVGEGSNGFASFEIGSDGSLSEKERNSQIEAYDIIAHPTLNNVILFASPNGIAQYSTTNEDYTLLSKIRY